MSGFKIDISGDLNKKVDQITANLKAEINDELNAFGLQTVGDAKLNAPGDNGFLKNSITFEKNELSVEIIVDANYAAFVEFGTGTFAAEYLPSLPQEIQDYAKEFFVNGKGRLPASPYLFPAVEGNLIKLKERLKALQ